MKIRGQIISLKRILSVKDINIIAVFFCVFTGLASGVLIFTFSSEDVKNEILKNFIDYYNSISRINSKHILYDIVISGLPYFFSMFIFGSSFTGSLFCPLITILNSMGVGSLSACFYYFYGLVGLEYSLLVFFPGKAIMIFIMLIMTVSSLKMSKQIIAKECRDLYHNIKLYCVKNLFLLLAAILYILVEFLSVKTFTPLFTF